MAETKEEMQRREAAALADDYLKSTPLPPPGAEGAAPSFRADREPAPSPEKPSVAGQALGSLGNSALGAIPGVGPAIRVAQNIGGAYHPGTEEPKPFRMDQQEEPAETPAAKPAAPAPDPDGFDRPAPPAAGGAGGAGVVIPGGMRPHEEKVEVTSDGGVSPEIRGMYGQAAKGELQAAEGMSEAQKGYYSAVKDARGLMMQAESDAAAQHKAVQAKVQQSVADRMARIDRINDEVNAGAGALKDPGALATIVGAIATGLGAFGARWTGGVNQGAAAIEAGINRQIAALKEKRNVAAEHANLLKIHLDQLGSEDMAVDATKKGLYQNALTLIDQEADRLGVNQADPKLIAMKSAVLGKYAALGQTLNEKDYGHETYSTSTMWHDPKVIGGPAAGKKSEQPTHVLTVSEGDGLPGDPKAGRMVHVAVPKESYEKLQEMVGMESALRGLDMEALKTRAQLREAATTGYVAKHGHLESMQRRATLEAELKQKQIDRMKVKEHALAGGVVTKADAENAGIFDVDYTKGVYGHNLPWQADTDKQIQNSMKSAHGIVKNAITGAGAEVVLPGESAGPGKPMQWQYTGKRYDPTKVAPEPDDE